MQRKPDALRLRWAEGSVLLGHIAPPDRYLGWMYVRHWGMVLVCMYVEKDDVLCTHSARKGRGRARLAAPRLRCHIRYEGDRNSTRSPTSDSMRAACTGRALRTCGWSLPRTDDGTALSIRCK